jgi:hypothetical protein
MYGVDVNPMAVELCKVSLWMETLEPGKPLTFLDHHIQCGHSLLGTTPALLAQGILDTAFTPLEGDDKTVASAFRKRNKAEREGQMTFAAIAEAAVPYSTIANGIISLDTIDDSSITGVHDKEERYSRLAGSSEYRKAQLVADAWCAAFVWRKTKDTPEPVTHDVFCRLLIEPEKVPAATRAEIARLAEQYHFFHWYLAFPDVFRIPTDDEAPENDLAGWNGGFDVVVGNPPWERIKIQEKEWFATRRPDIAAAPNTAARRQLISALATEDPELYAAFLEASRQAEGESHFIRNSGHYPLCGRGDINLYAIFAERGRLCLCPTGRMGLVLPSGIATDDTTKFYFQNVVETYSLVSLFDFENRQGFFPAVDSRMKFCLFTVGSGKGVPAGRRAGDAAEFVFFAHAVEDLEDSERRFTLSAKDIALLNPNTRTCPIFRSRKDAELTRAIYRRVPVLVRDGPPKDNPWSVVVRTRLWHMAEDAEHFRDRSTLENNGWRLDQKVFVQGHTRYLPLYEAKMVHQFDHRWATYEQYQTREIGASEKADPNCLAFPRYWVPEDEVVKRLAGLWDHNWLMGWRDITNATNERTLVANIVPFAACGDTLLLMMPKANIMLLPLLPSSLNGIVVDYVARQKIGGTHLKFHVFGQLPVLPPDSYRQRCPWSLETEALKDWLLPRVLELTYTAWDLEPFAKDCGYHGPPFRWDEERRFLLHCELDAAYFHLYGIARDDVDYIIETFPIVKRNDMKQYGDFRTKLMILDIYDRMQQAMDSGEPYQTLLAPPPADPHVAHPPRMEG